MGIADTTGPSAGDGPVSGDHVQRQRPKLGIFIDEQGATSVDSLLRRPRLMKF